MRQFLKEAARGSLFFLLAVSGVIAGGFALAGIALYGSELYAAAQDFHFDKTWLCWVVLFLYLWVVIAYLRAISEKLGILIAQRTER
jgi:hypothetical protein